MDHVKWEGCVFWDLIQPAFMFMVGVAMPFAFAKRRVAGESFQQQLGHAAKRALGLLLEPPSFRTRRRGQELQFRHLPEELDVAVIRGQHNSFQFLALLQRLQILNSSAGSSRIACRKVTEAGLDGFIE